MTNKNIISTTLHPSLHSCPPLHTPLLQSAYFFSAVVKSRFFHQHGRLDRNPILLFHHGFEIDYCIGKWSNILFFFLIVVIVIICANNIIGVSIIQPLIILLRRRRQLRWRRIVQVVRITYRSNGLIGFKYRTLFSAANNNIPSFDNIMFTNAVSLRRHLRTENAFTHCYCSPLKVIRINFQTNWDTSRI